MSKFNPPSLLPFLAILGSVTALGIGTSWAKHALFPLIGPQGTTAVRVGLSALLLLVFWRPWRWSLPARDAWRIAGYGVALGLMNLTFYLSLKTLPFGIAVAIEFAGPLAVAVLASRRMMDFVWIALACTGLALLLPLGHGISKLDPAGVLWALAAALCWALYILCGKRTGHLHPGHTVSLGLLAAAMVVVPVGIAHAGNALFAPWVLGMGIGIAVISSAIPISLEMVALRKLPPRSFGVMTSMEPAVAALLALGMLNEQLTWPQWLAIGLIMTASVGCAATAERHPSTIPSGIEPQAAS